MFYRHPLFSKPAQMKTSLIICLSLCLTAISAFSQVYYQNGGNVTKTKQHYTATATDESGVVVTQSGTFNLSSSSVTSSGATTSSDSSSFYGLNAGALVKKASKITLTDCKITTTGTGANGVFATDTLSSVVLTNDTLPCTSDGAHGVDATFGASLSLTDVVITTAGAHGAAISTDRGGGTVSVTRGNAVASGQDSPGIYCTGTISASDATISGAGAEAAVIEGANSITLTGSTLSGATGTRDRCVFIYQSMSGDATGAHGVFTMTGGSLTWPSATGPLFYFTNTTGVVTLTNVTLNNSSSTLIKTGADQWGTTGKNGGIVEFTASNDVLTGSVVCDNISSVDLTLENGTSLAGAINTANTAKTINLTIDAASSWNVPADSYVPVISDPAGVSGQSISNISGNGHTVTYDGTATGNSYLNQKIYTLQNGGTLTCPTCTPWVVSDITAKTGTVSCYPNPCSTVLNITTGSDKPREIQVFSLIGEYQYDELTRGNTSIDVSNWANGIYFVRVSNTVIRMVVMH